MSPRKKILIIAYHFPPIQGSSGYLRTLKFAKYLPDHGWDATVLTVHKSAYEAYNDEQSQQIPAGLKVHRTRAYHAKKHFSWRGRYPFFLALPDRMASWIPFALWEGFKLLRREKFDAVFSTYPIPSAHLIGRILSAYARVPWVADFRDIMWDEYFVQGLPFELRAKKIIERMTLKHCRLALVTTPSAKKVCASRYPELNPEKIQVVLNGFDEDDFKFLDHQKKLATETLDFLHSGVIDQSGRDPTPFLEGVAKFLAAEPVWRKKFRIRFLAPNDTGLVQRAMTLWGLEDTVTIEAPLPYTKALEVMANSDAFLIILDESCHELVPVKFYEYIRIGLPILTLTPLKSETANMIAATHSGEVVPLDRPDLIAVALSKWLPGLTHKTLPHAHKEDALTYSRQERTRFLASLLNRMM